MKKTKRSTGGIVLVLLILALFYRFWPLETNFELQNPPSDDKEKYYEKYEEEKNTIYVAFSKDGEENDPTDYTEFSEYTSVYSSYNARLMYGTLSPAEQQLYHLFEYAMDHEYTTIFFDSRLLSDSSFTLEEILRLYSMDSPLVQQNYSYSINNTDYTFSYSEISQSFQVTGTVFHVEGFSHEAMEKKKEALSAATEVFENLPEDLNQLEQARYFYRYLTREVEYALSEEEPGKQNNLYDAFLNKKTQCDGFSNAFSLLCAMAGIPCAEKVSTPENPDELGHTWNIFCADGVWYNADLAIDEDYVSLHVEFDMDFNFGFSDAKSEDTFDFPERFPSCTADIYPVDLSVSSPSDPSLLNGLRGAYQTNGKNFVYLSLESGELSQSDLQRIANYFRARIRTLREMYEGKTAYYIFVMR